MRVHAEVDQADMRRILKKCDPELLQKPLKDFFEAAALTVQGKARLKAPVDTGHLRNAIMYEVDTGTPPLWAKVGLLKADAGTELWYKARAMEYGTGRQGDGAVSHNSGHWPPGAALNRWGARHGGASGYAIAAAIGKAGGLRPRPYLRPGLRDSIPDIKGLLNKFGATLRERWG